MGSPERMTFAFYIPAKVIRSEEMQPGSGLRLLLSF
jgi:hypothetical protein